MSWRLGKHQPRNIYYNNQFIAVVVGEEEDAANNAWSICYALNAIKEKPRMRRPRLGDTVFYKLSKYDADLISQQRGSRTTQSNRVEAGQIYPAQIVRTFDTGDTGTVDDNTGTVNLQVNLDGNDTYWATSRQLGDTEGSYTTEG